MLTLDCGFATIKWQIIETDTSLIGADTDRRLVSGVIERIAVRHCPPPKSA